ncbi:MAG: glycosyltransferase [Candidatus Polarisedimenticolia bacterium]
MRKPAVAHVVECWLGRTETFIHASVASFTRVRPVIIARRVENLEEFPVPEGASLHRWSPARGTPSWVAGAVRRRLSGGEPHVEKILAREEARAIHAHYGPTACSLLEVRRRTRLPLFVSFYGYDASVRSVVQDLAEDYRRLFDLGNVFLSEGPAMSRRLEELGCPRSKIHIQRIGIDTRQYRFHPRHDQGGPLNVLMCGRMVAKKGYPAALRAFAEARRKADRLTLRLVGDGPDRASIETLADELGVKGNVTFLGALPRQGFLAEIDRAHFYLQPSQTAPDGDSEGGAPTALLEAQASGLPVVATRHADIPYVVREADSALLADEGDVAGLAAHLETLARSPVTWGSMGRMGRAHVEERHDVRELATRLEVLYASMAETGRAAG